MNSEKDELKQDGIEETPAEDTHEAADDPSLEDEIKPAVFEAELIDGDADADQGGSGGGDGDDGGPGDSEPEDEPDDEEDDGEGAQMSLLDHLGELRVRLTRSFIAIAVGMVACYGFAEQMFDILMEPMVKVFEKQLAANPILDPQFFTNLKTLFTDLMSQHGMAVDKVDLFVNTLQTALLRVAGEGHFQYTYPAEAFFSHIKISIVAGLFLVSPYVFAQLWGFIAPGLYSHERKWMIPMAFLSALFFTGGALFGYFQVFPYAFDFFAGFSTHGIQFTPKLNEYLSFCLKLLFAFGFVFELPLFIFFLARMGMVSSAGLRKKRKYAILVGFILAAVLTPPDPFTQCLMAGPLIILYEVGIWVAFFFGKKEKRHLKKQAEAEAAAQEELDKAAQQAEAESDAGKA